MGVRIACELKVDKDNVIEPTLNAFNGALRIGMITEHEIRWLQVTMADHQRQLQRLVQPTKPCGLRFELRQRESARQRPLSLEGASALHMLEHAVDEEP